MKVIGAYSYGNKDKHHGVMRMEITTPEALLGKETMVIKWHHGTCDLCSKRKENLPYCWKVQKPRNDGGTTYVPIL